MKQTTIRAELEDYLKRTNQTINQFAEVSGMNSGTISNIINGNRPIAMRQLDLITAGMGLAEGSFYDLYAVDCFQFSRPNLRRLRPFLYRCAELDKLDCIRRVAGMMLDSLSYVPVLFETAEAFFREGKHGAAAILYECVAESEKFQHSERLALCQYRLFVISLGEDLDANLRAATLFEGYVNRLDEADQLDALMNLAYVFGALHRWNKVDELAQELYRIANIQYQRHCYSVRDREGLKKPQRPLYSYILYALLIRSVACEESGQYEQALHYVSMYADGSWIQENTEEAARILGQFKEWATANNYLYRLMSGELQVLPEYVEYISSRADEIFTAIFKILQVANRYAYNIDAILERFSSSIIYRKFHNDIAVYNQSIMAEQYAQFLSELAAYYLHNNRFEGIGCILQCLDFSVSINSDSNIIRCMSLFEQYRHRAGFDEKTTYKNLVKEVQRVNEKKTVTAAGCM